MRLWESRLDLGHVTVWWPRWCRAQPSGGGEGDRQTDSAGMSEPPGQTFIRDDGPLSRGRKLTVFLLMKFLQFLKLLCRKRTSYCGTKLANLGESLFFQHTRVRPLGARARCGQGHPPSRDGARAASSLHPQLPAPPAPGTDAAAKAAQGGAVGPAASPGVLTRLLWDGNAAAGHRPCPHWPPGSPGTGLLGESSPSPPGLTRRSCVSDRAGREVTSR